jgi:primosomal protein N' (replication factor Y)
VIIAALPAGMSPKTMLKISLVKELDNEEVERLSGQSQKRRMFLNYLLQHDEPVSLAFLKKRLKMPYLSDYLESLAENGIIRIDTGYTKTTKVKKQKGIILTPEYFGDENKLKDLLDELDKSKPKHSILISNVYLAQSKDIVPKISSLLKELKLSRSNVNTLTKKGVLEIIDIEVDRSLTDEDLLAERDESKLQLTEEQQHCYNEIKHAIVNKEHKPILIHGVTGSGKTLIYIHAINHIIEQDKSVLLLVPEISLTPQLIDRFRNVFGNNIVALHSRMSDGERFDAWRLIRKGEKHIVIGARSAVFAPMQNLGLLIVDEEHEPSYKQDSPAPRYNARDTAVMRAKLEDIPIILGSATPSLESMHNAETGKYKLLEIKERADGAYLPEIILVDKTAASKSGQFSGSVSKHLIEEIEEKLKNKEGIIIFQNRRGFASFLECPDCGYIPECKNCSVSLTYHKKKNQLRCHYCGYTINAHRSCPACGYPELKEYGFGTQRIEDELSKILQSEGYNPVIQRVDLDSTGKKGSLRKIFTAFIAGEIDILVGTQMVAKGLDFERVTLVGVVNADLQMFLPDFRATERTFQLLTQVAGRSGRSGGKPGKVFIQTAHPRHLALRAVLDSSYDLFYKNELANRRELNYPPFVRFIVIEFSGKNEHTVEKKATQFLNLLPQNKAYQIFGVTQPFVAKLQNRYRRMIIIKGYKTKDKNGNILRMNLKKAIADYAEKYGTSAVHVKIDVDAYSTF